MKFGNDALGNQPQIKSELAKIPVKLEISKAKRTEIIKQLQTVKAEVEKPLVFEDELKEKTERPNALNIEFDFNEKDSSVIDIETDQSDE